MAQFSLIEELGLEALPEERKLDLLTRITDLLMKRLALRILSSLGEEDKKTAEDLLSAGDAERAMEFFQGRARGFDNILSEEMATLREELKRELLK